MSYYNRVKKLAISAFSGTGSYGILDVGTKVIRDALSEKSAFCQLS